MMEMLIAMSLASAGIQSTVKLTEPEAKIVFVENLLKYPIVGLRFSSPVLMEDFHFEHTIWEGETQSFKLPGVFQCTVGLSVLIAEKESLQEAIRTETEYETYMITFLDTDICDDEHLTLVAE